MLKTSPIHIRMVSFAISPRKGNHAEVLGRYRPIAGSLIFTDHISVAKLILSVLESYFWDLDAESNATTPHWKGKTTFMPHVLHWVSNAEPIRMMLPAFPFKSVSAIRKGNMGQGALLTSAKTNADKVLGTLPDFGEYLALARLNQLCLDIGKVYESGGEITIAADGVAFSGIWFMSLFLAHH